MTSRLWWKYHVEIGRMYCKKSGRYQPSKLRLALKEAFHKNIRNRLHDLTDVILSYYNILADNLGK
jgi:hypothetical protein